MFFRRAATGRAARCFIPTTRKPRRVEGLRIGARCVSAEGRRPAAPCQPQRRTGPRRDASFPRDSHDVRTLAQAEPRAAAEGQRGPNPIYFRDMRFAPEYVT